MGPENDFPKINVGGNRDEKKRSGLAALLLRFGIGSEAGGGAAGTGVFGNLLSAGLGGGILATKAGIIGLILVGTTVAGSLGVVAYKLFGPQDSDRIGSGYSSLFSPKPQIVAMPGQDGYSADGVSRSLSMAAQANTHASGSQSADASAAPAVPASTAAASASAAPPARKNDNVFGGTLAKLKSDKQFSGLTKGAASGSGGIMSVGGGAPGNAPLSASASRGNLGGLSASRAGGGGLGKLRSRSLGGGAFKQLGAVRKDQTGATSSQAAGRTYDGNTAAPAEVAPTDAGTSGVQESAADTNPPVTTGGGSSNSQFPDVPDDVVGVNVTPWQAAINTAMMALMGAAVLLMLASKVVKMQGVSVAMARAIIVILAAIAAALGAWVMSLGAEIGGGKYGQPLQGQLLSLAGGMVIASAGILAVGGMVAEAKDGAFTATAMGNTNLLMMVCGGAALAAMAWAYMAPKNSYDSSLFKDGRPPDYDYKNWEEARVVAPPSQGILDRYLA